METATRSRPYRTSNLTLATVLLQKGHRARMVRQKRQTNGGHPVIAWEFDRDEVEAIVGDFYRGEVCVEPEQFYRLLKETRGDLFDFMDGTNG